MGKQIKLRRSTAGGVIILDPETILAQIKNNTAGDTRATYSTSILTKANPSVDGSYFSIGSNGTMTWFTDGGPIGAADSVHSHTISEVEFLEDELALKVPLVGGVVPKEYFPEYVKGQMRYKGAADLTAGNSEANAIDVSTLFPSVATLPDEQVGQFLIVTVAGYLKADGVVNSGTEFYHLNTDGPVYLNIGDRIVFASYVLGTPNKYYFAFIHNDYRSAIATRAGVVQSISSPVTTRGALASSLDATKSIDEYAAQQVLRDIYYSSGTTYEVPFPSGWAGPIVAIYTTAQTGEPTHTGGAVAANTFTLSGQIEYFDSYAGSNGPIIITSTGKMYRYAGYVASPLARTWMWIATITPITPVINDYFIGITSPSSPYIYIGQNNYATPEPILEGDLLFA